MLSVESTGRSRVSGVWLVSLKALTSFPSFHLHFQWSSGHWGTAALAGPIPPLSHQLPLGESWLPPTNSLLAQYIWITGRKYHIYMHLLLRHAVLITSTSTFVLHSFSLFLLSFGGMRHFSKVSIPDQTSWLSLQMKPQCSPVVMFSHCNRWQCLDRAMKLTVWGFKNL